jgi:uncharacterized membrane-anchored protein
MRLEDAHDAAGGLWAEFWALFTDPAHAMTEIAMSIVWDVIVITLIYQILVKRWLYPRWLRRAHQEIDAEHGVDHDALLTGTHSAGAGHVKIVLNDPSGLTDG